MNPTSAEIWENHEVATGIFRLKLRPYGPVPHLVPGRFFMVGLGAGHDPLLRRPLGGLTVSVDENNIHLIEFLYEVRGRGTKLLSRAQPPRIINFIGPLGSGFNLHPPRQRLIMVAGGMGVVPLYAAARLLSQAQPRPRIDFIFGARTGRGLVLRDEIEAMSDQLRLCTEDGCLGEQGLVTAPLALALADVSDQPLVLACGPRPMLRAVAAMTAEKGVDCQVSLEARMGCGLGACLTCVVARAGGGHLRVCKEGPVFDAKLIDWEAIDGQA